MSQSFTYTGTSDYIAAPDLMQTVNVAVQLSRPLLIKGEPGTGKTMLAEEVAQDVFVKLLRSAATYEPTAKFKTFLYRIATMAIQMGGGRDNSSRFGERMTGSGVWAELARQRFRKAVARLGKLWASSIRSRFRAWASFSPKNLTRVAEGERA